MPARNRTRPVQLFGKPLIKDLVHQRTLSRTRYSCDTCHNSQRKINIYILQVILPCTGYPKPPRWLRTLFRHWYTYLSAQICTSNRSLILHDLLRIPLRHDLSAVFAGTRSNIHDIICLQHRVLIMLHNND